MQLDELQKLIDGLSKEDKELLLAKSMNFARMPVDIMTFINDDYYLGKQFSTTRVPNKTFIFPLWADRLQKLFPDPFHTDTYIVAKGCIRSGKSMFSKLVMAYDVYRISCMADPGYYFSLGSRSPIFFKVYCTNLPKAQKIVDELWEMIYENSPYFQDQMNDPESTMQRIHITAVSKVQHIVSDDVCSFLLSEVNFASPYVINEIISESVNRIETGFRKGIGTFSHVILDSSDRTIDSPTENFVRFDPRGQRAKVYTASIWASRPWDFQSPKSEWFKCYAGDYKTKGHIMQDGEPEDGLDPDRIFLAPPELRINAEGDFDSFLMNQCGMATVSSDQFLDPEKVKNYCIIEKVGYDDIETVSFYDQADTLIARLDEAIRLLPKDRQLFGRIDLGTKIDHTGFAIGFVENMNPTRLENGTIAFDPDVVVPIALAISRYPGEETNIQKLIDLVLYIHDRVPFYSFTTDTYQSTQIRQALKLAGVNTYALSVDRTDQSYIMFKNALYRGKVRLPKNTVLMNELSHLKYADGKIDHPQFLDGQGDIGSNSKDICLHADTQLYLLSGRQLTIEELYNQWEDGQEEFVMSLDTNNKDLVPVRIKNVVDNGVPEELYQIFLDNGKSFTVTGNHLILNRNSEFIRADNLKIGDSLMPFNYGNGYANSYTYDEYPWVMNPYTQYKSYTFHIVRDKFYKAKYDYLSRECSESSRFDYPVTHHINHNKQNSLPSNLQVVKMTEHRKLHGDIFTRYNQSEEKRERNRQLTREGRIGFQYVDKVDPERMRKIRSQNGTRNLTNYNKSEAHKKVASIVGTHTAYIMQSGITAEVLQRRSETREKLGYNQQFSEWISKKNSDEEFKRKQLRGKWASKILSYLISNQDYNINNIYSRIDSIDVPKKGEWTFKDCFDSDQDFYDYVESKYYWDPQYLCFFPQAKYDWLDYIYSVMVKVNFLDENYKLTYYDFQDKYRYLFDNNIIKYWFNYTYDELVSHGIPLYNHKIIKIEKIQNNRHVYDLVLGEIHNFGISAGVWVHNCDAVAGLVSEALQASDEVMELPITKNPNLIDDYSMMLQDLYDRQRVNYYQDIANKLWGV